MGLEPLVTIPGIVAGMNEDIRAVGYLANVLGGTPGGDPPGHGIGPRRDARHVGSVSPPGQLQGEAGKAKLGDRQDAFGALVGLAQSGEVYVDRLFHTSIKAQEKR